MKNAKNKWAHLQNDANDAQQNMCRAKVEQRFGETEVARTSAMSVTTMVMVTPVMVVSTLS